MPIPRCYGSSRYFSSSVSASVKWPHNCISQREPAAPGTCEALGLPGSPSPRVCLSVSPARFIFLPFLFYALSLSLQVVLRFLPSPTLSPRPSRFSLLVLCCPCVARFGMAAPRRHPPPHPRLPPRFTVNQRTQQEVSAGACSYSFRPGGSFSASTRPECGFGTEPSS